MRRQFAVLLVAVLAYGCGGNATGPSTTLKITGITPSAGSTNGETAVTIDGTGFVTGTTVMFAGTAATNVVVVSSTQITATAPVHAVGTVDVAVTNPGAQTSSITSAFLYSDLSGAWSGTTSQGKPITFAVNSSNVVTAIDFDYVITGNNCTASALEVDDVGTLDVSSMKFSVSTAGHAISGTFSSVTSVTGSLTISSAVGCVGSVTATWTATKG
jgi:hypothetical protein